MLKVKSIEEIRALLVRAGVAPNQSVVTDCAVGLRASHRELVGDPWMWIDCTLPP
jgi:hypothetical protein